MNSHFQLRRYDRFYDNIKKDIFFTTKVDILVKAERNVLNVFDFLKFFFSFEISSDTEKLFCTVPYNSGSQSGLYFYFIPELCV